MTAFLAMTRRELGVYFVSPTAYIILTALLFFSGLAFAGSVSFTAEAGMPLEYASTIYLIAWVLIMASPLVTMRLIAEEKSRGTMEIMMTAPVSEAQFVLAKFTAALLFHLFLLAFTVSYVIVVSFYGQVDAGAVASGYLGVLLVGALIYSIGIFISSLCSSQVTAAIVTFAVALVLFFAGHMGASVSRNAAWRELLEYVDLNANIMDFFKGVLDTRRLVYLLSGTVLFLFLTTRVVESRRWR